MLNWGIFHQLIQDETAKHKKARLNIIGLF